MEDSEIEERRLWKEYRDELRQEALDRHARQIEAFLIVCQQNGLPVDQSHLDFSHPLRDSRYLSGVTARAAWQ